VTALEGPAASWLLGRLGPMGRWLKRRVTRDHLPIAGRKGQPNQDYYAFFVFAAMAPSRSPKPLPPVDFMDRARELVEEAFPGAFPALPEHSSAELVRYRSVIDGARYADRLVTIYPTGLVELQWAIAVPPITKLPLTEVVAVVQRLQLAVQTSAFSNLHRRRRWAKWRRVDWRLGVNGWAIPAEGGNRVNWSDVDMPGGVPSQRTSDPHPYCPRDGYAASQLTSRSRHARPDELLAPVLHELLASGGYLGGAEIRERVVTLLAAAEGLQLEAVSSDDKPELDGAN
jgi:hypothetical protein